MPGKGWIGGSLWVWSALYFEHLPKACRVPKSVEFLQQLPLGRSRTNSAVSNCLAAAPQAKAAAAAELLVLRTAAAEPQASDEQLAAHKH